MSPPPHVKARNAIVVMAVGDRHRDIFQRLETRLAHYASRCEADLLVCTEPPDPGFHRGLLTQKLLLPYQYRRYDWLAYLDLDVLISPVAPSLFHHAVDGMALGAVPDPRGTARFRNVALQYWKRPDLLAETHASYFSDRGYPWHAGMPRSINGGVWLCRPALIAAPLRDMYHSDFQEPEGRETHEEGMLAFVAQSRDLYFPLPETFNTQVLYAIFETRDAVLKAIARAGGFKLINRMDGIPFASRLRYPRAYVRLVQRLLESNHIVHFAGRFPYLRFS